MFDLFNEIIQEEVAQARTFGGNWPATFIHAESRREYAPHHKREESLLNNDEIRHILVKGGEGCIAAGTLIGDIPAAEWGGGDINSLSGLLPSSSSYKKGRSGLYRVQTEWGKEVLVTLDHRFLTPTGWHPLRHLSVGSQLAVHDNERVHLFGGTPKGYRGRYSLDSRPCGELSNPSVVDAQGKLLQLASFLYEEPCLFSLNSLSTYHSCSDDCSFHEGHSLLASLCGHHSSQIFYAMTLSAYHTLAQQLPETSQIHKAISLLANLRHLVSCVVGEKYPVHLGGNSHQRELDLFSPLFGYSIILDYITLILNLLSSSLDDTTRYSQVERIDYVGEGDFYDLSVPIAENYIANGIVHHNSGKSVFGIVKTLDRLRRGMSGIMVSPNLPHFKRSLWPEFVRWCPWNCVIESQRHRRHPGWTPSKTFEMVFLNEFGGYSRLICGGIENPLSWEGPNVNFAHIDEARGMEDAEVIRVLGGRTRIMGPDGTTPQIWITTTPRKHWLFEYFGGVKEWGDEDVYEFVDPEDEKKTFKLNSAVMTLATEDNVGNSDLDEKFVEMRGSVLSEAQKRVRLAGLWEDEEDTPRFLEDMTLWDRLKEKLPPLKTRDTQTDYSDTLIIALDGAVSKDHFALVGVSRHPNPEKRQGTVAVRMVRQWIPKPNKKIDFDEIELYLREICKTYNVVTIVYDPYQLHKLCSTLNKESICWFQEFSQNQRRWESDQMLYDVIVEARLAHDGNDELRSHIDNADKKSEVLGQTADHRSRMVKRTEYRKIDLAVALSMATHECLRLNL